MTDPVYQELATAVLDGEATSVQRERLQALLANDPALRAEFEAMQAAQAALGQVAPVEPPAGLVGWVMTQISSREVTAAGRHQLSSGSSVNGSRAGRFPDGSVKAVSPIEHLFRFLNFLKENVMSDQKSGFFSGTKGRVLAGGGIALAALVVIGTQVDFSGISGDTAGTIAPAERYRANGVGGGSVGGGSVGGGSVGGGSVGGGSVGGGSVGGGSKGG
jgi:anti-sigma factor RsiW